MNQTKPNHGAKQSKANQSKAKKCKAQTKQRKAKTSKVKKTNAQRKTKHNDLNSPLRARRLVSASNYPRGLQRCERKEFGT